MKMNLLERVKNTPKIKLKKPDKMFIETANGKKTIVFKPVEEVNRSLETNNASNETELIKRVEILESEVAEMKTGAVTVNDEATQSFMATLSSSETNSIAKIRAAAQQYLNDTSNEEVI